MMSSSSCWLTATTAGCVIPPYVSCVSIIRARRRSISLAAVLISIRPFVRFSLLLLCTNDARPPIAPRSYSGGSRQNRSVLLPARCRRWPPPRASLRTPLARQLHRRAALFAPSRCNFCTTSVHFAHPPPTAHTSCPPTAPPCSTFRTTFMQFLHHRGALGHPPPTAAHLLLANCIAMQHFAHRPCAIPAPSQCSTWPTRDPAASFSCSRTRQSTDKKLRYVYVKHT